MTIDNVQLRDGLIRYYKSLEATGFVLNGRDKDLLIISFILELISMPLNWYLTIEDLLLLRVFSKRLSGDCFIPWIVDCENSIKVGNPYLMEDVTVRITEVGDDPKISEDGKVRVKAIKR